MNGYTKGPWEVRPDYDDTLIAAAPDLIAALEECVSVIRMLASDEESKAYRVGKAALAKAKEALRMTEHIRYAVMRLCEWKNIGKDSFVNIIPHKGSVGYIDVFRTRADAEDMAKFYEPTGGATIIELTLTEKEKEWKQ